MCVGNDIRHSFIHVINGHTYHGRAGASGQFFFILMTAGAARS